MRDDAPRPLWPQADILASAAAVRDGQFLVPPVLK
jgi:Asp-tRNA(Asn)/Glu-tRNA(Gln) amidotransferase C subunit